MRKDEQRQLYRRGGMTEKEKQIACEELEENAGETEMLGQIPYSFPTSLYLYIGDLFKREIEIGEMMRKSDSLETRENWSGRQRKGYRELRREIELKIN
ncbi:hypothetical protein J6590_040488 [Homalodisca vitripennis]|nr:hypothetical protein J6590_040488 [Homalodisca vitripennis]